jgi:ABC-type molybdate transport system substrate-binding protein
MKLAAAILCLALAVLCWPQASVSHPAQKPEELAQKAAESWLALTDSGKYAESWDEASSRFKAAVTKDKWISMVAPVRDPLGKVLSRALKSATYTTTLPGAPDGQYVVIQYDTAFEHKKSAVETITSMLDKDGTWRVSGYFIK